MTNLEQHNESIDSSVTTSIELNDLKTEVLGHNFGEDVESMEKNKTTIDEVLGKVNELKQKESELREESEYRVVLGEYVKKLTEYSNATQKNIEGTESQINYGTPNRKKINKYVEDSNTWADEAKNIENGLKGIEKEIQGLIKDQNTNDRLNKIENENRQRNEELNKREEELKKKEEELKKKEEKLKKSEEKNKKSTKNILPENQPQTNKTQSNTPNENSPSENTSSPDKPNNGSTIDEEKEARYDDTDSLDSGGINFREVMDTYEKLFDKITANKKNGFLGNNYSAFYMDEGTKYTKETWAKKNIFSKYPEFEIIKGPNFELKLSQKLVKVHGRDRTGAIRRTGRIDIEFQIGREKYTKISIGQFRRIMDKINENIDNEIKNKKEKIDENIERFSNR